jgi:hypothetical protein
MMHFDAGVTESTVTYVAALCLHSERSTVETVRQAQKLLGGPTIDGGVAGQ